jgi:hypothetical protein
MMNEEQKKVAPIVSSVEGIVRERIKEGQIKEGQIIGLDFFSDEEKREALTELCKLYYFNPIAYAIRLKEVKALFGCAEKYIELTVKKLVERAVPAKVDLDNKEAIVEMLVQIAKRETKELWHNEYGVGYASIERDGHVEIHQVEKADYQYFISRKFGEEYGYEVNGKFELRYPPRACLKEAVWHLESHARDDGEEKDPRNRIIKHNDALCIDEGDRNWHCIVVTSEGWGRVERMEAPLIRGAGMKALPEAVQGGDIRELREFANVRDDADFVLFCGTMATILNPFGNFLTQFFCGPAGSGKTTATRVMRALTDPHKNDTRRFISVRDLLHGAPNTHVIALENVSHIDDKLSDTICALNTATGTSERKYYAQGIEWSIRTQNPVIINGIPSNLATRSDLLDRSVTFVFDYLGERVRSDDVFWRKLNLAAPRLFGALLDGLVGAMKVREEFSDDIDEAAEKLFPGYHPRFVDAVVWAEAACRTMGFEPGEYVEAYRNNQDVALRHIGENDPICDGIRKLIAARGEWCGYPQQLCDALRRYLPWHEVPNAVTLGKELPWFIPILWKVDCISVKTGQRLYQDDNRNGIMIVGVGRGTLSDDQPVSSPPAPAPIPSVPKLRRL